MPPYFRSSSSSSSSSTSSSSSHPYARPAKGSSSRGANSSAVAPATNPPPKNASIQDPFYGHEETATTAARFIMFLFGCPEDAPLSKSSPRRPSLAHFVAYALHRTRLHPLVATASLLVLSRLKARFPTVTGSSGHRLFLCALMIASKSLCDDTYSNTSWVIVGQDLFTLPELNRMEREFLSYLEWNCVTYLEELHALESLLHHSFSPPCSPIEPSLDELPLSLRPYLPTYIPSASPSPTLVAEKDLPLIPSRSSSPPSCSTSTHSSPSSPGTPSTLLALSPTISPLPSTKLSQLHDSAADPAGSWFHLPFDLL